MRSRTWAIRQAAAGVGALLAVILQCATVRGAGPWVPFVAQRISRIYRVSANGKVLVRERSEVWLRNSQGSLYQRNTPILAPPPRGGSETAMLFDATTGTTYLIDYTAKTVKAMRRGNPLAPPPATASFHSHLPSDRLIGRKTILGIECEGWRMPWASSVAHPAGETAGEMWVAPSLNFVPLDTVIVEHGIEIDTQVTAIQPDTEPDPEFFQFPQGFSVEK